MNTRTDKATLIVMVIISVMIVVATFREAYQCTVRGYAPVVGIFRVVCVAKVAP